MEPGNHSRKRLDFGKRKRESRLSERIFRKLPRNSPKRGAGGTPARLCSRRVPSKRGKVVQAGNIGEFSQLLPQCGKPLFLQGG